jgi:hypothetical protein
MHSKGLAARTSLTLAGRVEYRRRRYAGVNGQSRTPIDALLDEAEATVSLGVRELCCRLGLEGRNFDRTAVSLRAASGLSLSGEKLRQVVEGEGRAVLKAQQDEQLELDWTAADCAAEHPDGTGLTRVYVGSDGLKLAVVTAREKDKRRAEVRKKRQRRGRRCRPLGPAKAGADDRYKEFKIVTFYDQDQSHRHVAVTRGDCQAAGRLMARDADRLRLGLAQEKIGNVDGADWIVKQMDKRLKLDAVGLDFYHLAENLHEARRQTFGLEDEAGKQWAGQALHAVKHEGYEALRRELVSWRGRWRSPAKRREADRLLHYITQRQDMIRYPQFIEKGWQIGSGPTESMCKAVAHRLKSNGMRWDADNAEAIMALESLYQSTQWDAYWRQCLRTAA